MSGTLGGTAGHGRQEGAAAEGSAVPGPPQPGWAAQPAGLSPAPAARGSARPPGVASPLQTTRKDPGMGFAAI